MKKRFKLTKSSPSSNATAQNDVKRGDEEEESLQELSVNTSKMKNPFFGSQEDREDSDCADSSDDVSDSSEDDDESDDESDDEDAVAKEENPDDDDDDDDDLIKQLKRAKEKTDRTSPPDIKLRDPIVDLSMHPKDSIVAAATLDGAIKLFSYSNEGNKLVKALEIHKKDPRSIEFDGSGARLYSGSQDKSLKITDVESCKVVHKIQKAHESALYKVTPVGEHLFASGDEDGTVKLWDHRRDASSAVMEHKPFDDFVSDFYADDKAKTLVASSGEGLLQSFNLRGKRPDIQSEVYEGELNCLCRVHHDSKLVAGCGDGKLYMFHWGQLAYHSAEYPGHPDAINDLVAATDNVVITACEDGVVRAVHLYPHRFIGTVGQHDGGFGVEKLDTSGTGELVASISHDHKIKFWNIAFLETMEYKKRQKPFNNRMKYKIKRKDNRMNLAKEMEHQLPSSNRQNASDFFDSL